MQAIASGVKHIGLKNWKVCVGCKWWPCATSPYSMVSDPHKVNLVRPAQC